jgi:hypothetical protein
MPLAKKQLDRNRVNFTRSLTDSEIEQLISDPDIQILQCCEPVELDTWDLLNRILFAQRPEITLRVYGFYSSTCDLSFLNRMENVRRFCADCLIRATGIEHVATLEKLEHLRISVYNLDSFDFLKQIPDGINSLSLGPTKSKKPRLDYLSRFQFLSRLGLAGQQRGIEVLSDLMNLEDLTLACISAGDLNYISKLPRLWSLDIKLGGTKNLSAIAGKESIKYLELWQIRGLADLGVVSSLRGLQSLFLQSLRNVSTIPDLSRLSKLRKLYLENMKGLKDVSAIFHAPALEDFIHISAQNIPPEKYNDLMNMPTLRHVLVGFGSKKKNEEFEQLVLRSGKNKYRPAQFTFE